MEVAVPGMEAVLVEAAGPAVQDQVEDPEVGAVVQGVVPAEEVELGERGEVVAPVEERNFKNGFLFMPRRSYLGKNVFRP